MAEFVMPTLGADMSEGTLVQWKKQIGDRITKGDIIAEVDTEKAAIEVECHAIGIIEQLLTKPGDQVPVGTVMAVIREEGQAAAAISQPQQIAPQPAAPQPVLPPGAKAAPSPSPGSRLRISPAARKLATERGFDPTGLQGTGPERAVTLEAIERATAVTSDIVKPVSPADRQARMRQTIAAAMARSKREIPHYYLSTTIDMGRALAWLKQANEQRPVTERLLYGVLLIKAVALALRQVPELNALWKDGDAGRIGRIHIGTAISLRQGGLVAPALHDADRIVVYPGEILIPRVEMDEEGVVHEFDDSVLGEAWEDGPVLLSWHGGDERADGVNIVIHDFAHKLDMANGGADGFPALPATMSRSTWAQVFTDAYAHFCAEVDADRPTLLDPYAAEHPAEFFAVASEVFFEGPCALRAAYSEVYAQLSRYYRQDPARHADGASAADARERPGEPPVDA